MGDTWTLLEWNRPFVSPEHDITSYVIDVGLAKYGVLVHETLSVTASTEYPIKYNFTYKHNASEVCEYNWFRVRASNEAGLSDNRWLLHRGFPDGNILQ